MSDSSVADFARLIIVGLFVISVGFASLHVFSGLTSDYNNTTSTISYFNITVVDKYIDKDLMYDDYYVICKDMSDNEIHKVDDMQLYYNVEVGKSYNISVETIGIAMIREVVGEI